MNSHNLQTLQQYLQNHIQQQEKNIYPFILSTQNVSAQQRLAIYREGYFLRLTEALLINYPCLAEFLGKTAFNDLAQGYIQNTPSSFRSIRWFGHNLPAYLKQKKEYIPAELAAFEWKVGEAFDAADAPTLDMKTLESIKHTDLITCKFRFKPSIRRINCIFNTPELWHALIPSSESNRQTVTPFKTNKETQWVVWRQDYETQYYMLTTREALMLDTAIQGASFLELCEVLLNVLPETAIALNAATFLKGWITRGLISEIY